MKYLFIIAIILSVLGLADATFLTYEHFTNSIPPCTTNPLFGDCGTVLKSSYATMLGIPIALIGMVYYTTVLISLLIPNRQLRMLAFLLPIGGFVSSLYFVYLQLFVIQAICIFCMGSALISMLLLFLTQIALPKERHSFAVSTAAFSYKYFAKPIFFQIPPEIVHSVMTKTGNLLGSVVLFRIFISYIFRIKNPKLAQTTAHIHFSTPIGLAAGFDYEAQLTQILPSLGFGFETVGTITNHPYNGNPKPILGRLPKSRSLMVNKGFKNLGVKKTIKKLSKLNFDFPLGVSIGRTNSNAIHTQSQAIEDIVTSFIDFENSIIEHSFYELNISCPNLFGDVSFYPPKNLNDLLTAIDKLKLTRPLFIKMPIEKTDHETIQMLDVIIKHSPVGVIFGNLQKDRTNPALDQSEVAKFSVGNFSGKPTYKRSNELIKLSYKKYGTKLIIIGCGGVFNAHDAYEKITLGASLIQLITGMVFEGPQLISKINMDLVDLLNRDGFKNISDAIGSKNK